MCSAFIGRAAAPSSRHPLQLVTPPPFLSEKARGLITASIAAGLLRPDAMDSLGEVLVLS